MVDVERTVTTSKPIATVWSYLSDFTTSEQWDPPSVSTTRTSGDGGVGTVYQNTSKLLGAETDVTYTVTEYVEHERFQLQGDAGSIQLLDTLTFASTDAGGTSVTYHAEFTPTGAAKLTTPLLPPALQVLAEKVQSSLQQHLDQL